MRFKRMLCYFSMIFCSLLICFGISCSKPCDNFPVEVNVLRLANLSDSPLELSIAYKSIEAEQLVTTETQIITKTKDLSILSSARLKLSYSIEVKGVFSKPGGACRASTSYTKPDVGVVLLNTANLNKTICWNKGSQELIFLNNDQSCESPQNLLVSCPSEKPFPKVGYTDYFTCLVKPDSTYCKDNYGAENCP